MRRAFSGLVALCLLAACASPSFTAASSPPPPPTCLGRTAAEWQAAGYVVVMGTDTGQTLNASWRKSVVFGLGGNDRLNGGSSDDVLCGGDGDDTLYGGGGINTLVGGRGADELNGGPKRDDMIGGEVINGAPGDPPAFRPRPVGWYQGTDPYYPAATSPDPYGGRLYALGWWFDCDPDDGADRLIEGAGGAGEEPNVGPALWGCADADYLDGGDGDENLDGGDGDDTLIGGPGNDRLAGGAGEDYCDGGLNQGAVHPSGEWAAVDSHDGTCEVVTNIP